MLDHCKESTSPVSTTALTASVALCTCNGERFLAEQLESILAQSIIPHEVVLCDDASEDRTIEIAQWYEKFLPLRIIKNHKRLGTTRNFCKAIEACSEDIIILCDQDDVWDQHKVQKILSTFNCNPYFGMFFSDAKLINQNSDLLPGSLWQVNRFSPNRQKAFEKEGGLSHLLRSNIVTGATMAFKAQLRELLLPIPSNWTHDYWIATIIAAYSQIYCDRALLTRYRVHDAQQIGLRQTNVEKLKNRFLINKNLHLDEEKYSELKNRLRSCEKREVNLDAALFLIECKIAHIQTRRKITSRVNGNKLRLMKEVVAGNYSKFSFGWIDIFSDLVLIFQSDR